MVANNILPLPASNKSIQFIDDSYLQGNIKDADDSKYTEI